MILDPLSPALRDRRGGPELHYKQRGGRLGFHFIAGFLNLRSMICDILLTPLLYIVLVWCIVRINSSLVTQHTITRPSEGHLFKQDHLLPLHPGSNMFLYSGKSVRTLISNRRRSHFSHLAVKVA